MKKSLFFILLVCSICIFTSAQTFVTGSSALTIKVKPNTLFYNGKGLIISNSTSVFSNEGNVKVAGGDMTVTNTNPAAPDEFILEEVTPGTVYGQLIVESTQTTTGKINLEKTTVSNGAGTAQGFPFKDYSSTNITSTTGGLFSDAAITGSWPSNPCYLNMYCGSKRYNDMPIHTWDNKQIEWDPIQKDALIPAINYNVVNNTFGVTKDNYTNKFITFRGTPNNLAQNVTIYAGGVDRASFIPVSIPISGTNSNNYKVKFYNYIKDATMVRGTDANWGKNFNQFSNPYTSGMDLSYIGINENLFMDSNGNNTQDAGETFNDGILIPNLHGVTKPSTLIYNTSGASGTNVASFNAVTAAADGSFVAGDGSVLLIKPMETFIINLKSAQNTSITNVPLFNDKVKTFSTVARVTVNNGVNAGAPGKITFSSSQPTTLKEDLAVGNFYQVCLKLWDAENNKDMNVSAYVVLGENLVNGFTNDMNKKVEMVNTSAGIDKTSLFTKQEIPATHGVDPNHADKFLYINQINHKQAAIPIPVFLYRAPGDNTKYKFKADLAKNLVAPIGKNFDNIYSRFYFRDKELNKIIPMDKDFEYEFEQETSTGNRFEIFVGMINTIAFTDKDNKAQTENKNITESVSGNTVIYKDKNDKRVIRFDKTSDKANVSVYSAIGQIVYSKKDVNTDNDLVLPLENNLVATYIIKIEYNKGETVTKKVID